MIRKHKVFKKKEITKMKHIKETKKMKKTVKKFDTIPTAIKTEELTTLTYEPPLAIHNVNFKQLDKMLYSTDDTNYKIIENKHKSIHRNMDIITNKYTSHDFILNYIVKDITLELIYLIQEQFILAQNMNNNDNFYKVWNKSNFKLFHNIINHPDPYFKAKLDNQIEFEYLINYSFDINIYDHILKMNIDTLTELKTNEPIKIFSPFCEDGTIIYTLLRLIKNQTKHSIDFIGSTYHKQAYEGYNEIMNLFKMKKHSLKTPIFNNWVNIKYSDPNEINKFMFYYGDYNGNDILDNSLNIIDTYIPLYELLEITQNKIASTIPTDNGDPFIQFINTCTNKLKNNGLLIFHFNELNNNIIFILQNIIHKNYKKLEFLKSIRISNSNEITDHDKYIFIFKKVNISIISKSDIFYNYINIKLDNTRTIKILFDDCNNKSKSTFNCDNGYLNNIEFLIKKNKIKHIKDAGYSKITYILRYVFVDYDILFKAIKEVGLELTVIFTNVIYNEALLYLFNRFIQSCKYKYNFEVLFMNNTDLEKYKSENKNDYYYIIKQPSEDIILYNRNLYKEYLTPLFENIKTVWHTEPEGLTKHLCILFPHIQFNFIINHQLASSETKLILNYKKLNLPNLKVYTQTLPFIPFPNVDYSDNTRLLPNYVYYYSTLLKYAKDGDLFYSSYYV